MLRRFWFPFDTRAARVDAVVHAPAAFRRRGVIADVYVVGGAAMALAYDARRSTRDIDAVFEPHGTGDRSA